ncbi:hypothetical protein CANARDRAFT_198469 [[Candida] arabinofermentans NRRL YB-2248]|uniref:Nuclear distribution protein PAC1 n=1 Tax=[Candida] arabinofermentans NRRL YB-2248 TaxID=983967 RepID=A0A1E4T161_9ASCO|nr:hypothetical protein CANARDRAFT_198469 [[Candida] arabinofermentans NRRL YB-2248]
MTQLLTDRQIQELNKSIIQYLKPKLASKDEIHALNLITHRLLNVDLNEYSSVQEQTIPSQYLEKKWSTVLRLQKKIYDMEKELNENKELIANYTDLLKSSSIETETTKNKLNWIPKRLKNTLRLHNSSVTALSIHPSKPILASGSNDGSIILWNLLDLSEPDKIIKNAHTRSINGLVFQNDPKSNNVVLASCSSDLLIKLWDCKTGKASRTFSGHDHLISHLMFSPTDSNLLISCSRDKSIKVWNLVSGWCIRTIVGHSDWVRSFDVSSDGVWVLSCSNDLSVRLSDISTGVGVGLCIGHQQVVEDVVFLPRVVDEYLDGYCKLKKIISFDSDNYDRLGFKYCASCGRDSLIKLWRLPVPDLSIQGKPMPGVNPRGELIYEIKGHASWIRKLQVHPNGIYLGSCSDDKTVKIWNLTSLSDTKTQQLTCLKELKSHESFVNSFEFAKPVINEEYIDVGDEKIDKLKKKQILEKGMRCYLVSGSADDTVKLWV